MEHFPEIGFPEYPSLSDHFVVNPKAPKKISIDALNLLIPYALSSIRLVISDSEKNQCMTFSLKHGDILNIIYSIDEKIEQAIQIVEYGDAGHKVLDPLKRSKAILWLIEGDGDGEYFCLNQSMITEALRSVESLLNDAYTILDNMIFNNDSQKQVA